MMLAYGLGPAYIKGTSLLSEILVCYTFIWNFVNFPAGAIPITHVMEDEQEYVTRFDDANGRALKENAKGSKGLPIGI